MDRKTIIITGGHLTPALTVIEEIRRRQLSWDLVFVGRTVALDGVKAVSEEERLVTGLGITFVPLKAGRWPSDFSLTALGQLLYIPAGFVSAFRIVRRLRPAAVMAFGGYLSLPVAAVAAGLLRIPVLIHEQAVVPGLANRILAHFATDVCVSHPETAGFFRGRARVTGLPVRRGIYGPGTAPDWQLDRSVPLVYISGGSTGSRSVNRLVFEALSGLTDRYTVVHQTGHQGIEAAEKFGREKLPAIRKKRYQPVAYLDLPQYAWLLGQAACFVGRSGANTVAELTVRRIPAVFIPLPWSRGQEQLANARLFAKALPCRILSQDQIAGNDLAAAITAVTGTATGPAVSQPAGFPEEKIVDRLERVIG